MIKIANFNKLIRKMSANIIKLFKKKMKHKRNLTWKKKSVSYTGLNLNKF